ncbi:nitroreductase [Halovulum dunhuangense]|uniref:Putative NAD(P)H nitroreductase n=1 Tax=Halovulum dunhuangense TaxID=1505036 RepID=A0A849L5G0_9RHOB|nr:nitroreductase [Halovulum dunhuangense]NNU81609.1 nitroreductase [Halovulum dunhuangense]
MPDPRPEVLEFLLTRRSRPAKTLAAPAPDEAGLEPILRAGLRVPDHGKLEPWRLVVIGGTAPARLGEIALRRGLEAGMEPERAEKAAMMFIGAPLIVAVVASPVASDKIPAREQFLSAGAVCLSLVNAALAAGWGASWLTGWTATDAGFLEEALALAPHEEVAGYVVIGTETAAPPERPRPDMAARIRRIDA